MLASLPACLPACLPAFQKWACGLVELGEHTPPENGKWCVPLVAHSAVTLRSRKNTGLRKVLAGTAAKARRPLVVCVANDDLHSGQVERKKNHCMDETAREHPGSSCTMVEQPLRHTREGKWRMLEAAGPPRRLGGDQEVES